MSQPFSGYGTFFHARGSSDGPRLPYSAYLSLAASGLSRSCWAYPHFSAASRLSFLDRAVEVPATDQLFLVVGAM